MILAAALPFVPRRDDTIGLAALCGALLVAFQLATSYWFYFYLVWALPAIFIALIGRCFVPAPALSSAPAAEPVRVRQRAAALSSG